MGERGRIHGRSVGEAAQALQRDDAPLAQDLRGLPQRGAAALGGAAGHGLSGFGVMAMFTGPASW